MFRSYRRNTGGNVAMMFSVSLFAMLVGIGAAVDFTGASSRQTNLQGMVDAATLAAARAKSTDLAELTRIATDVVAEHNKQNLNIELNVRIVEDEVIVTGKTIYDTHMMSLVGRPEMDVAATAGSPIAALTPVKVALVLDTTGSMAGSSITALKQATTNMVDVLEDFEAPVAVSVVPFGQYVNVGLSKRGANWLDVAKDGETETGNFCRPEMTTPTPRVCTPTGNIITYDIYDDGRVVGQNSYEEQSCTGGDSEPTGNEICEDKTVTYAWNGCVGSRPSPYNQQAAFGSTRIPGVMNEVGGRTHECGTELLELTKSMDTVRGKIASLTTGGWTYLPSGLAWGWRTLQDSAPLKTNVDLKIPGAKRQAEPAKVMIFMTDGENTRSQGGQFPHLHSHQNKTAANARTLALCNAAKADGIQIYTVGYRMTEVGVETRTLLQNCATNVTQFRSAENAAELKKVFKDIANQLDFARLTM